MLSLDNSYNAAELKAFDDCVRKGAGLADQPVTYVAEMKIDGLSLALTYEDGLLIRGATRGNGTSGEDVTATSERSAPSPCACEADQQAGSKCGAKSISRAPPSHA